MKIRYYMISLLCLLTLPLQAQDTQLQKLTEAWRKLSARVTFAGRTGDFADIKGRMFHLELDGMKIWYDGETLWNLREDELYISRPDEQNDFMPHHLADPVRHGFQVKETDGKIVMTKQQMTITIQLNGQGLPARIDIQSPDIALTVTPNAYGKRTLKTSDFRPDTSRMQGVEVIDMR